MRKTFKTVFTGKHRRKILYLTLLCVLNAFVETFVLLLFYPFMSSVLDPSSVTKASWYHFFQLVIPDVSADTAMIVFGFTIIFFYLSKGVYQLLMERLRCRWLVTIRAEVTEQLFQSILHQSYYSISQKNTAALQRNLTMDVNNLFLYLNGMMAVIKDSAMGIAFLLMLLSISALFTLIFLVVFILLFVSAHYFISRRATDYGRRNRTSYYGMVKVTNEVLSTIKVIITNQKQDSFIRRYRKYSEEHAIFEGRAVFFRSIPMILYETVIVSGMLICVLAFIRRGINIESMIPGFITFALATVKLIPVVSKITGGINSILFYRNSVEQIAALLSEKGDIEGKKSLKTGYNIKDGIFLKDISFAYPGSPVLFEHVTLEIKRGQITGIAGTTGAGKTTLIDLILGLYLPTQGSILVDDVNLKETDAWGTIGVGYVPQRVNICDDTIRSNVAFGIDGDAIDNNRVMQCLREACLEDYVLSLPEGIDSLTGENGAKMSGGQVQRLGIARALYENPQLLVLDEATSALDAETEQQILKEIQSLRGKRTVLLISHRESAIRMCDKVYRIQGKQVISDKA